MPDDLLAAWGQTDQVSWLPGLPWHQLQATRVLRAAAGLWEPPSWPHRRGAVCCSLSSLCLLTAWKQLRAAGTLGHCWSQDWRLVCSQAPESPQTHIFTLGLLLNYATD